MDVVQHAARLLEAALPYVLDVVEAVDPSRVMFLVIWVKAEEGVGHEVQHTALTWLALHVNLSSAVLATEAFDDFDLVELAG